MQLLIKQIVIEKKGVHNLIEHPGKTQILMELQFLRSRNWIEALDLFFLSDSV
jgi:hypothetical protein